MKKEKLMTFCDMIFVLVLCFVVLLATMLLTSGKTEVQPGNYMVSLPRLAATAGAILFYLIFMLRRSLKSLDEMTEAWEAGVKAEETDHGRENVVELTNRVAKIKESEKKENSETAREEVIA